MRRGRTERIGIHLTVFISCLLVVSCTILKFSEIDSNTQVLQPCTLVGCEDTLAIAINGDIPDEYWVLLIDPEGKEIEFRCTVEESSPQPNSYHKPMCDSWGFWLSNYSPYVVDITIKWNGENISKTVQPSYEYFYPNGTACPPGCRNGSASIAIQNSQE